MRLFIAEKPQLAQAAVSGMANAASAVKSRTHITVGDDIFTWCFGHMLEQKMPEEINPELKLAWDSLPYPVEPELKIKPDCADQVALIQKLIKQADTIVNLGDVDEEGQLLVDELLEFSGINPDAPNIQRMLLPDMNPGAATKALADLRQNSEPRFRGMRERAKARSYSDYIFGINLSSALKLKALEQNYTDSISIGRVQTPVLGLVVRRFEENKNFTTAYFYRVLANVDINGQCLQFEVTVPDDAPVDDKGRIISEEYAKELREKLAGQTATVTAVSHTPKKTPPPLPLSLLRLSSRLDKQHGISPADTLRITQDLREKYRCITYNRTDCQYLTVEQWNAGSETLETLRSRDLGFGADMANVDTSRKSRAFNDDKISAHTAICPVPSDISKLAGDELTVFTEISRLYLAQFLPDMETLNHKIELAIGEHAATFSATECTLNGWKSLFMNDPDDEGDETAGSEKLDLSGVEKGTSFVISGTDCKQGKTTPPALFTAGSLMDELPKIGRHIKNPALRARLQERDKERAEDGRGIGTPATRPGILETLELKRGFWTRNKKGQLIPTDAGIKICASLPPIFTWPDLTAAWEEWMAKIETCEIPVSKFIDSVVKPLVATEIENLKTGKTILHLRGAAYTCSRCKTRPLRRFRDKENADKFYWICAGTLEEGQPCKAGYDDLNGKPVARKKKTN
ncbi:type IA DNA topoisomerase [Salmonella enterica]